MTRPRNHTRATSPFAPPIPNSEEEYVGSSSGASYGSLLDSEMEGMVSDQEADLEDELADYRAIAAKGVW